MMEGESELTQLKNNYSRKENKNNTFTQRKEQRYIFLKRLEHNSTAAIFLFCRGQKPIIFLNFPCIKKNRLKEIAFCAIL